MMKMLAKDLEANRRRLGAMLHWPEDIGVEMRDLTLGPAPGRRAFLCFVDGLVLPSVLSEMVIMPLQALKSVPGDLSAAADAVTVYKFERERAIDTVVRAVLAGKAALVLDGADEALLLDVADLPQHHRSKTSREQAQDVFGRELRGNVALVRRRVADPALRVVPVAVHRPDRAGQVALLYLEGKVRPAVVRLLRCWVRKHVGEEAAGRGTINGVQAVLGLLPRFSTVSWPDEVANLVTTGTVFVLMDRQLYAFGVPVALSDWLSSASDWSFTYPMKRTVAKFRLFLYFAVLVLPGSVVAVMNYHHEMVPTTFLMAIAATRENSPFGIFFEVLLVELLTEVMREATFRLPIAPLIGTGLAGTILVIILGVLVGFVGPLPALGAAAGAIASLALPSITGMYFVRLWRFYLLGCAVLFGFFGMAAGFAIMLAYLCQARSWGLPFYTPSGWEFTSPETVTPGVGRRKGGRYRGKGQAGVR